MAPMTDKEALENLADVIADYIKRGGKFDMPLKQLPFYSLAYNISKRKSLSELTPAKALELCGVPKEVFDTGFSPATMQQLKIEMDEFVNNGNSLKDTPIKKTPFYRIIDVLRRKPEYKDWTAADFYEACGYVTKRGFSISKLERELAKVADPKGYVDCIKERVSGDKKKLGRQVSDQAEKFGCSPAAYLLLMTDYRYKRVMVQGDYIEHVRKELLEVYDPGETLIGLKSMCPKLYDKVSMIAEYTNQNMKQTALFLGFDYDSSPDDEKYVAIDKFYETFMHYFPSGEVPSLGRNSGLYRYAMRCARSLDISVKNLFKSYGFKYKGLEVPHFNRMLVDFSKDEEYLLGLKQKYYSQSKILNNTNATDDEIDLEKERILKAALLEYDKWKESANQTNSEGEGESGK